jgi:gamma-glutamylcyclotransferase (GGCT)/AIG2-like uncharacterized protein YtfP
MKHEESIVEGILYEIQDSDLERLDKYEGYTYHYRRIKIKVKVDDGEEVEATTYVARHDKVKDSLKPNKEYLEHLLKWYDLLSREYFKKLRGWETLD